MLLILCITPWDIHSGIYEHLHLYAKGLSVDKSMKPRPVIPFFVDNSVDSVDRYAKTTHETYMQRYVNMRKHKVGFDVLEMYPLCLRFQVFSA